jgi:hypothetical protein
MACKKIGYKTKKLAKKAVHDTRKQPLYLKGKYIKEARQTYYCKKCNEYHITSRK